MDRYSTKPCVFDGVDFQFWKAKMKAYIMAQSYAIWEKVAKPYDLPADDAITPTNLVHVENNYKARNFIIQGLQRSDFDRVSHLASAHEVWNALCSYHEGSNSVKEVRQDMYKKEYMRFEMKTGESLDEFFARFNKILSNLRALGVTYTDAEASRQLLSALDMSIWEMKVTSIRESTIMSTLTLDILYSKLKTHELDILARRSGSKSIALVTNPSNSNDGTSSHCYALSSLSQLTDEQLEQCPEEELALLTSRFSRALQNIRSRKRGGNFAPRCFECGDPKHFRQDCPKFLSKMAKEGDRDNSVKEDKKNKRTFNVKNKKRGDFARAVAHSIFSVINEYGEPCSSDVDIESDEDDTPKGKRDITGMCLMASNKSTTSCDEHDSDNDNEVELSYDELLESASKLSSLLDHATKRIKKYDLKVASLNSEITRLKSMIPDDDSCKSCNSIYSELTSLRSVHDDTLDKLRTALENNEKLVVHKCKEINDASMDTSDLTDSTSCNNCHILELKLKDANARISHVENALHIHEVVSCANCKSGKQVMDAACDNCLTLSHQVNYLQASLQKFSSGHKNLNMILDKSKVSKNKTGLGFNAHAHFKANPPTIVKSLGNGIFETSNKPTNVIFKSAGIMSNTPPPSANVDHTSHAKPESRYICSHCNKSGHVVGSCFRLARLIKKQRKQARSNSFKAHYAYHNSVAPKFVPRVNVSPSVATCTRHVKSVPMYKETRALPTRRMSQYWIPKRFLSNPSTETSACVCCL
jgi:hypothetical protein